MTPVVAVYVAGSRPLIPSTVAEGMMPFDIAGAEVKRIWFWLVPSWLAALVLLKTTWPFKPVARCKARRRSASTCSPPASKRRSRARW